MISNWLWVVSSRLRNRLCLLLWCCWLFSFGSMVIRLNLFVCVRFGSMLLFILSR